jgi:hypothetical protein
VEDPYTLETTITKLSRSSDLKSGVCAPVPKCHRHDCTLICAQLPSVLLKIILNKQFKSDSLRAGRSRDRIPVEERFSAPSRRPWSPPGLLYNGYPFFPGGKRQGRSVNHPPSSSVEVKERAKLYLYSPSGSPWQVDLAFLQTKIRGFQSGSDEDSGLIG